MRLSSLDLNQFRCFDNLRVSLPEGVVIFHGDNARGKTSILEAICVLLRLQSPRTSNVNECIKFETVGLAVGGTLETGSETFKLRMQLRESGRKLFVDGETQRRTGDYLRQSGLVVWMANDDLALVRGGGETRRRYLDFIAIQLFADYRPALKAYEKALRTRNFLLKRDASPKWDQIDAYTQILVEQGKVISERRSELTTALDPHAQTAQFEISGRRSEDLQILYRSGTGESGDLGEELTRLRGDELKRRRTLAGPHLDDLEIRLNGMPAAKFASEGQQRTVALSFKLAQTMLFIDKKNQAPLLLIDDVFGELDPARRNCLMANWPVDSQKIITTTNLDWLDEDFARAERFLVSNGAVEREN